MEGMSGFFVGLLLGFLFIVLIVLIIIAIIIMRISGKINKIYKTAEFVKEQPKKVKNKKDKSFMLSSLYDKIIRVIKRNKKGK